MPEELRDANVAGDADEAFRPIVLCLDSIPFLAIDEVGEILLLNFGHVDEIDDQSRHVTGPRPTETPAQFEQ